MEQFDGNRVTELHILERTNKNISYQWFQHRNIFSYSPHLIRTIIIVEWKCNELSLMPNIDTWEIDERVLLDETPSLKRSSTNKQYIVQILRINLNSNNILFCQYISPTWIAMDNYNYRYSQFNFVIYRQTKIASLRHWISYVTDIKQYDTLTLLIYLFSMHRPYAASCRIRYVCSAFTFPINRTV